MFNAAHEDLLIAQFCESYYKLSGSENEENIYRFAMTYTLRNKYMRSLNSNDFLYIYHINDSNI